MFSMITGVGPLLYAGRARGGSTGLIGDTGRRSSSNLSLVFVLLRPLGAELGVARGRILLMLEEREIDGFNASACNRSSRAFP
jgi:hypothetical protein